MDHDFWHDRWQRGRIGFHESKPNPLLVKHFPALSLAESSRVFLPLCGKTLDIGWLLSRGHRVVGVELSELAIMQLFEELDVKPAVAALGNLKRYSADNIDIFVGDIFDLTPALLGPVDAVFDRAALVALPSDMRSGYASHVAGITSTAPQLLVTFEYDPELLKGPPFSVPADEIKQHYSRRYAVSTLSITDISGGFKGVDAKEHVWLLTPREC
ncbi:thiopurine S-methyltransferase [Hoeflea halophila]|uniref:Thiopurine S-methyltransferase n=1 Tax=Hoeflea halophila TaxID=714899 RepID=A0A286IF54_9HYPH|nr:thiopurine S-methyltransferase [Hoeflea halophila]SOE18773.1 thiopurine S-methyltransferase [Hoeflea halophila]